MYIESIYLQNQTDMNQSGKREWVQVRQTVYYARMNQIVKEDQ